MGRGAAGGAGRAPLEVVAHLVQKDHYSSNLGHVPLNGALGVNRGANAPLLLLTGQRDSMHTGEMQQIAGLRAHAHR